MEQNSEEWYAWRQQGIGASDAPIIMGVSPYTTRFELWQEKTGRKPRDLEAAQALLERGHILEEHCRPQYELKYGYDIPPCLMEHPDEPWLRASLDGFNREHEINVEFKWIGRKNYDLVVAENVPLPHHVHQLQHQMLVSGCDKSHYVVWSEHHGRIHVVEVERDDVIMRDYYSEAVSFWELVQSDTAPELCDRDEVEATGGLAAMFEDFKNAKEAGNRQLQSQIKDAITGQMPHTRMRAHGVLIYRKSNGTYGTRVK